MTKTVLVFTDCVQIFVTVLQLTCNRLFVKYNPTSLFKNRDLGRLPVRPNSKSQAEW